MNLSEWLKENGLMLHILVTRHFGQWGFECQLILQSAPDESKETYLKQVTGEADASGVHPCKLFLGFGVRKFESIEGLIAKASGKTFCYTDPEGKQHLLEFPTGLSAGDKADYNGLVKGDDPGKW